MANQPSIQISVVVFLKGSYYEKQSFYSFDQAKLVYCWKWITKSKLAIKMMAIIEPFK